jgi:hypothetical protein
VIMLMNSYRTIIEPKLSQHMQEIVILLIFLHTDYLSSDICQVPYMLLHTRKLAMTPSTANATTPLVQSMVVRGVPGGQKHKIAQMCHLAYIQARTEHKVQNYHLDKSTK